MRLEDFKTVWDLEDALGKSGYIRHDGTWAYDEELVDELGLGLRFKEMAELIEGLDYTDTPHCYDVQKEIINEFFSNESGIGKQLDEAIYRNESIRQLEEEIEAFNRGLQGEI